MNTIFIAALLFTFNNTPVTDMREGPSQDTKMDSQAMYAERVEIIEEKDDWAKVKTSDDYCAWLKKSTLYYSNVNFPENKDATIAIVNRNAAHLYHITGTEYGPILTLPFESKLEVVDQLGDFNGRWIKVRLLNNSFAYIQRGDVILNPRLLSRNEIVSFSKQFLGLPYTYGGRSSFGYDCSGFVQMIYRQMGLSIPRNSSDQSQWEGFRDVDVKDLQEGDLIFFGRKTGKVGHVGMYLGENQFIHANVLENKPYIIISDLNKAPWNCSELLPYRIARRLKE